MDDFLGQKETIKETVERFKKELPDHIDSMVIQAQLLRAKYDALIGQGFTKEQVLELCKKLGF